MKETATNYGMAVNGAAPVDTPLITHFKTSSMDRKAFLTAVKECFDTNTEVNEYFVTKDAQCFTNAHSARNHERFLGVHNSGVEKMTRDGVANELKGKKAKVSVAADPENGTAISNDDSGAAAGGDATGGVDNNDANDTGGAAGAENASGDPEATAPVATAPAKKAAPKKSAAKRSATKKK